jgi:hypothetical protein
MAACLFDGKDFMDYERQTYMTLHTLSRNQKEVMIGRSRSAALRRALGSFAVVLIVVSCVYAQNAQSFAQRVFDVTKSGDFKAYQSLMHGNCNVRPFTKNSFELRSDILRKLKPGAKIEVVALADYRAELEKRGAPPDRSVFSAQPSHMVIVRGSVAGVSGGDHVTLNPILNSGGVWKLLDGDCIGTSPAK